MHAAAGVARGSSYWWEGRGRSRHAGGGAEDDATDQEGMIGTTTHGMGGTASRRVTFATRLLWRKKQKKVQVQSETWLTSGSGG